MQLAGAILSSFSIAVALLLDSADRVQLILAASGACALAVTAFAYTWRTCPDRISPRLVTAVGGLQAVWIAGHALISENSMARGTTLNVDLAAAPFRSTLPLILPGLAAALVTTARMLWTIPSAGTRITPTQEALKGVNRLTYLSGVFMLLFWPASDASSGGWLSFGVRVVHYALTLVPLLIGRFGGRRAGAFWWGCAILNATAAFAQGARLPALQPVVLWGCGRLWRDWRRLNPRRVLILCTAGIALLFVSGVVGKAREIGGRRTFEEVDAVALTQMASSAQQVTGAASALSASLEEGTARMIVWANPVVFCLSPGTIPYRGTVGLTEELSHVLGIAILRGESREDILERGLGTAPAREYGFRVTEQTSVEFPALADAWSRGGIAGCLLICVLWTLVALQLEAIALRRRKATELQGMVLLLIAVKAALDPSAVPFLAAVRGTLLYGTATVSIAALISIRGFRRKSRKEGFRRQTGTPERERRELETVAEEGGSRC